MFKIKRFYPPIIIIFLVSLFLFRNVLNPGQNQVIYGGDLLTQFYYWKGFLAANLKSGTIPFWNPYNFSGTPFLAHPGIAAFYPGTLLFLIFPLNLAFSLTYLLHLFVAGVGMFFLCRIYANLFIATLASLIFISSGYFSSRIYAGHIDLFTTSVWIPWVIFSYLNLSKGRVTSQKILVGIVSFSLLILAGYNAYVVFTLEFLLLFFIYLLIINIQNKKNILISGIFIIFISIGITAAEWIPTWQLTKNSIRGSGLPYSLASYGSLPASGLKLFLDPLNRQELNKISFNLGGGPVPNPFDHYPGKFSSVLIIVASLYFLIFKKRINRDYWLFIFICLMSLWFSFGYTVNFSLHYFLYQIIPIFRFIRIPMQQLILLIILFPVLISIIFSKLKSYWLQFALFSIIFYELFSFNKKYIFLTKTPSVTNDKSIIRQIKTDLGHSRILPAFRVISPILNRFDFNSSMLNGFESTSGYDPVILKNYYEFIDASNGSKTSSLTFYNVEIPPINLISQASSLLNVGQILYEDGTIIQNKNYRPRFYFEKEDRCINDLSIINYSLNKIILKSQSSCDNTILSSEVFYPGWQAKIDSKITNIIITNKTFRAIKVPKGEHLIEYYYSPRIYIIGIIISASSLILLILFLRNKFIISRRLRDPADAGLNS